MSSGNPGVLAGADSVTNDWIHHEHNWDQNGSGEDEEGDGGIEATREQHHASHAAEKRGWEKNMNRRGLYSLTLTLEETLTDHHGRKKPAHHQKDKDEEERCPRRGTHPSKLITQLARLRFRRLEEREPAHLPLPIGELDRGAGGGG
jgi:hypothetical protein